MGYNNSARLPHANGNSPEFIAVSVVCTLVELVSLIAGWEEGLWAG